MPNVIEYEEETPQAPAVIKPVRPANPSVLGWPPMLPFELAMRQHPPKVICKAYGIDKEEFETLVDDPHFAKAYTDAVEGLRKEGMSFRIKARLQAEAMLDKSWKMVMDESTPNTIKADLIKSTVRWAGYEPKGPEVGAGGSAFMIQINLGD